MARTIGQRELRNDNARIIDAVTRGETFVITRHGTPVAELRPYQPRRRTFVPKEALDEVAAAGPHVDAARFRADLDAVVDPHL